MPYGQSSVNYNQSFALLEGQVVANSGVSEILERLNLGTTRIPFGRALLSVSGNKQAVVLPSGTTGTPQGISIFNSFSGQPNLGSVQPDGYPQNSLVSFVRGSNGNHIEIAVYSATATEIDDPVYFRHANGSGLADFGTFRNSANADYTLFPGVRFNRKTTAAGLTVISMSGV